MAGPAQVLRALRLASQLSFSARRLHLPASIIRPSASPCLIQIYHRQLSLGSIFGRNGKPPLTPSPSTVATIARIEAEANADPSNVHKQLALFQALVNSGVKPGYEIVVSRWERMCAFDTTSPLLRSDAAFQIYLTALAKLGLPTSIASAVRRRDSLLGIAAAASSAPSATTDAPSSASATPASPPTDIHADSSTTTSASAPSPDPLPMSSSQLIAQMVLSSDSTTPLTSPQSPEISRIHAAFMGSPGSGVGVQGNPLVVTLSEPTSAIFLKALKFLVTAGIGLFLVVTILAVLLENSGLMKAGPRTAQFEPQEGNTVRFSDVHGVDEAKEELKDVVEFLKDPTAFASLGGKLPKGVLLTGSPGTGKTMLARAVAGEAGVPFFFASGSEFEEMFVGVGAKRVRELFAAARKKQPAIVFIDELDAVGGKRNQKDQQYMKQTLNQLLVEMDGFLQSEGVIVIAATNFPESLDQALVRPGRFDRHIAVPLPDIRGRVQILNSYMKDVKTGPDADAMVLARGTSGFSGADLQNMVNQAAIQASKEGAKEVTLKHFEWAKDRIVMGAERKSQYIDEKNKLMTAYHEGGHALVALYTEGAMPLHKVTCVPRGHALGVTSLLPADDRLSVTLKEYLASIDVMLGGRVAENLIYGPESVTSGCSSDISKATTTANNMVKYWGFSDKLGPVEYNDRNETLSPHTKEQIEAEVRALIQAGEARVTRLLRDKEEELHRLAHALVEHETLDLEEVKKVIKGEPIRGLAEKILGVTASAEGEKDIPSSISTPS